jgi:hypothetical protein
MSDLSSIYIYSIVQVPFQAQLRDRYSSEADICDTVVLEFFSTQQIILRLSSIVYLCI